MPEASRNWILTISERPVCRPSYLGKRQDKLTFDPSGASFIWFGRLRARHLAWYHSLAQYGTYSAPA